MNELLVGLWSGIALAIGYIWGTVIERAESDVRISRLNLEHAEAELALIEKLSAPKPPSLGTVIAECIVGIAKAYNVKLQSLDQSGANVRAPKELQ